MGMQEQQCTWQETWMSEGCDGINGDVNVGLRAERLCALRGSMALDVPCQLGGLLPCQTVQYYVHGLWACA